MLTNTKSICPHRHHFLVTKLMIFHVPFLRVDTLVTVC